VATTRLLDKWGSKDAWLRALSVRLGLLWLFREEFTELELGRSPSLESVLAEAYRVTAVEAARCTTNGDAFSSAVGAVSRDIDRRMAEGGDNSELERLKKLVSAAQDSDPLKQMFDDLAQNARRIYRASRCRRTALERQWLISHPYGESRPSTYNDPYHVDAETRLSGNTARIELQIYLDRFDVQSLLVIPALLTHELVCHAHAQEDQNNDKSYWAEGFMDWASAFFLNSWVLRIDLPCGLVKDHCGQLWGKRMTPWRYAGRLAAETLVQWFADDRSVRDPLVAQNVTARFALDVNVVQAPLPSKDELASRLLRIRQDAALQTAVRAWRHENAPAATVLDLVLHL
jgi:hypothetical protein